jgi:hypothetical protein
MGTDKTGGMGALISETEKKVNEQFGEREAKLLLNTTTDLAKLRPKIGDKASFDKLVGAINEATRQNHNLATLQQNVLALGKEVVAVAKQAADLLA